MLRLCLTLVFLAFVIAVPLALAVRALSRRLRAVDSVGVVGQVKSPRRWVPNTGGIVVYWAFALPILAAMLLVLGVDSTKDAGSGSQFSFLPAAFQEHVQGLTDSIPLALLVLGSALVLHVLGLLDDRKPLGPFLKLGIMLLPALAVPLVPELPGMAGVIAPTRLLTLLDSHVGGSWLSVALTTLYILVLINAFNFMDNMDGLSVGVASIAAACFLGVALAGQEPQWFVAGALALLLGALIGFWCFNFPFREWDKDRRVGGASIFLGDGGSLVVGFLLAFLSIRITYATASAGSSLPWHVVLTPLVILAVPLYDFASVVLIRVSQGKSPFVGDLQHLSHRIEQKGLTRRQAVLVIYLFSAAVGLSGMLLPSLTELGPYLLFAQVIALMGALALFEWSHAQRRGA
jgi:UDP-GlcNAc:undecaprenyl-phosphate/decaprenyl-phosphate GlcNAc-1-phosphate transferase